MIKKCFKYFIGYKMDDKMLPKMTCFAKCFIKTKYMSCYIKNKQYNAKRV